MFTGLVEEVGTVTRVERVSHGSRLRIATARLAPSLALGDSIAVDGVCLTAIEIDGLHFDAEVSPETIACTNLAEIVEGREVNLERPLAAGDRLGGHFVQGHVDAVTRSRYQRDEGDFVRLGFDVPDGLGPFMVEKGSIAVNGVSLTIAELSDETFDVQLVPHTLKHTNLTSENRAEALNVEVDVLGKYVARLLEGHVQVALPGTVAALSGDD